MQYSLSGLALFALALQTTVAVPSAHRRHRHERRMEYANPDWTTEVNWATVDYSGAEASATSAVEQAYSEAAPTSAAAVTSYGAAASSSDKAPVALPTGGSSSGSGGSSYGSGSGNRASSSQQCTAQSQSGDAGPGFGGITAPVDTGNSAEYIGNVGCPYGSNIKLVGSTDGYKYTNVFKSSASSPRDMIIWLKAGPSTPTTHNTGQYEEPAMSFTLQPGETQIVAFDENTQPVFCDWTEKQKNADGSFKCAYGEADFGSAVNGGWGGFDVSNIQNDGGPCGLSLSAAGQTSTCTQNVYSDVNAAVGGIGGNIAPGVFSLLTEVSES